MATELAKAYVQVVPSMNGISGSLTNLLAGEAASAGTSSGATIGTKLLSSLKSALPAVSIAAIGAGIVAAFKSCVNEGMEFDSAMSQLAATMGVTTDEIGDLRDVAQEMGATTAFSATEAAEGLNILAMAGLSAEEQTAVLGDVLNLASAGALSLEDAASYVTGTIKGFGSSMDDASYYADLMAKGATLANTDVNGLGEALSQSAATASSYGQSADGVTLSLLKLAEQNVTGSEAATALNRAMADLYTPTDEAKTAMEELGVACYDEAGNARDFNDIVDDLSGALSGMSEEQANAYKDTIFTTQGLSAFNKMCATSSEKTDEFKEALADIDGSAAQQAETQLDNLAGDMTLFQSAMSGLKIGVSDAITPALRGIVQFGTAGVTALTSLITGTADVPGKVSGLITTISDTFTNTDWEQVGTQVKDAIVKGIEKILIDVPTVFTEFFQSASEFLQNVDWQNVGYTVMTYVCQGIKLIVFDIPGVLQDFISTVGQALTEVDWQNVGYTLMTAVLTGIKLIVVDVPTALFDFTQSVITYITEIDWLQVGSDLLNAIIDGIVNAITNGIPTVAEKMGEFCQGLIQAFKDFFGIASPSTVMEEQGGYLVDGVINALTNLPGEMLTLLTSALQNVTQWGGDLVTNAKQAASNAVGGVITWFTQLPGKILTQLNNAISRVASFGSTLVSKMKTAASNAISGAVGFFTQLPGKILTQLNNVKTRVASWGSNLVTQFKNIGKNVIQGMINGITGMVSKLYSSIKSALSGLVSKAKSALGIASPSKVFRDAVGAMIPAGMAVGIEENISDVQDAVGNMVSTATDSADSGFASSFSLADDMVLGEGPNLDKQELNATLSTEPAPDASEDVFSNSIDTIKEDISSLLAMLQQFFPQFASMQMVTDTGALVGEIAPQMDKALGKISVKKARGSA